MTWLYVALHELLLVALVIAAFAVGYIYGTLRGIGSTKDINRRRVQQLEAKLLDLGWTVPYD